MLVRGRGVSTPPPLTVKTPDVRTYSMYDMNFHNHLLGILNLAFDVDCGNSTIMLCDEGGWRRLVWDGGGIGRRVELFYDTDWDSLCVCDVNNGVSGHVRDCESVRDIGMLRVANIIKNCVYDGIVADTDRWIDVIARAMEIGE